MEHTVVGQVKMITIYRFHAGSVPQEKEGSEGELKKSVQLCMSDEPEGLLFVFVY